MKVSEEAVIKAQKRNDNDKDLILCLNNLVCPKCSGDLKTGVFPSYSYECRECNFRFTSADEAKVEKRLERNGKTKYV